MNREQRGEEKARHWQQTIGEAASQWDIDPGVLPVAPAADESVLLVAAPFVFIAWLPL